MTRMESIARDRIRMEPMADGLRVVVASGPHWALAAYFGAMLALTIWGLTVLSETDPLAASSENAPPLVVDVAYGIFAAGATFGLAWSLAARHVIEATSSNLALRKEPIALGLGRTRRFDWALIRDLRAVENPRAAFGGWFGPRPGAVAFDYGPRTIRFCAGIDRAEAVRVVAALRQVAPHSLPETSA